MRRTQQVPCPPNSPSPPPHNNKVITQRQYREKESECITALRNVIKRLTGEELTTRNEILRKAIDLLLSLSEIKAQGQAVPVIPPAMYETTASEVVNLTNTHLDYSSHSSSSQPWSQSWQDIEFDAQNTYYTVQPDGQLYYHTSDMDHAFQRSHDFPEHRHFGNSWPIGDDCRF